MDGFYDQQVPFMVPGVSLAGLCLLSPLWCFVPSLLLSTGLLSLCPAASCLQLSSGAHGKMLSFLSEALRRRLSRPPSD